MQTATPALLAFFFADGPMPSDDELAPAEAPAFECDQLVVTSDGHTGPVVGRGRDVRATSRGEVYRDVATYVVLTSRGRITYTADPLRPVCETCHEAGGHQDAPCACPAGNVYRRNFPQFR
jgi:hypothetical protein